MGKYNRHDEPQIEVVSYKEPKAEQVERPETPRTVQSFDAWWMPTASSKKLSQDLKQVLKKHFEARGFMASGEFDAGMKDFGL